MSRSKASFSTIVVSLESGGTKLRNQNVSATRKPQAVISFVCVELIARQQRDLRARESGRSEHIRDFDDIFFFSRDIMSVTKLFVTLYKL